LLECYQDLAKKFPQGLADVNPLPEELSGAVAATGSEPRERQAAEASVMGLKE
jgi:hypothetical protein